jgi:hypothetical protein
LRERDNPTGWKDCDSAYLVERLYGELRELERVLKNKGNGWLTKMWMECADIANFAMMIQDVEFQRWVERTAEAWGNSPMPGDEDRR